MNTDKAIGQVGNGDNTALGLDVGGSATRWSLAKDGRFLRGNTTGFSGHISNPDVLRKAKQAITTIMQETGPVDNLVAGVSGLSRNTAEEAALAEIFSQAFRATHIGLMSDIELAYRAAFQPGQGILVYSGTGSIAAHLATDGTLHTAGGKGVLIDDAGGGYWIAVSAMRAILRAEDTMAGTGWFTELGRALASRLGGTEWPLVRSAFYGLDRGGIAMLAMAVGEAAAKDDPAALAIMQMAGHELALLGRMLTNRLEVREICLAGRASMLHPDIVKSMQNALPGFQLKTGSPDAAKTAMNLAQQVHDLAK